MLKGNTIQLKGKRAIKLNNKCFSNVFHEQKKTTRLLLSFIELRLIISPHCCRHSVNFCVYSKRAIFCKRKKMNSSKAFSCSIANKIMWYYQQALCFFSVSWWCTHIELICSKWMQGFTKMQYQVLHLISVYGRANAKQIKWIVSTTSNRQFIY